MRDTKHVPTCHRSMHHHEVTMNVMRDTKHVPTIHLCHASFICVAIRFDARRHMDTHINTHANKCTHAHTHTHTHAQSRMYTDTYVRHFWLTYETWLIGMCGTTPSFAGENDFFVTVIEEGLLICVTRLIHMCHKTHSYMCDKTDSHVRISDGHEGRGIHKCCTAFISVARHSQVLHGIHKCHATRRQGHSQVSHHVFISITPLIYGSYTTHA